MISKKIKRIFQTTIIITAIVTLLIQPTISSTSSSEVIESSGKIENSNNTIGLNLAGVNINCFPQKVYSIKDFSLISSWNIDTVTINFGWNFLEPTKGNYDTAYLAKLDGLIQMCESERLNVILRFHTWGYASQAQWDINYFFCFPEWIGKNPDFWEKTDNQFAYIGMWEMLAQYYQNESTVIGFNLFAEPGREIGYIYGDSDPWSFASKACTVVSETCFQIGHLYQSSIDAIHSKSPDKIVIFEGFGGRTIRYFPSGSSVRILVENPDRPNTAWGRTLYQDWNWEYSLETDIVYDLWQIPYIITEFGIKSEDVDNPNSADLAWLDDALQKFQNNNFSWIYWGYGPGKGDYNLVDVDGSISPAVKILSKYSLLR